MPKGENKKWKNEKIQQVLSLYKQGLSMSLIGKQIGGKAKTVRKYLVENGTDVRQRKYYSLGERNPAWKGGRVYDSDGYVLIYTPNHPYRNNQNKVREHRLLMEKALGRYLLPNEVIDHINSVKNDNRLENLRLFAHNSEHLHVTLKGHVPKWTEDGLARLTKASAEAWQRHYKNCPKTTCVHGSYQYKNHLEK